ncbi:GntR family transcriptional regulator [Gluconacetobacter tumulisoli]|uniref:GntR family transcriptional regulator n=1 Tax=Gluconacetobacter tumulisoli TaxID=1286189 RepID=A0A7W4PLC7_9PROT|nr:GntR family transcriptional regulator [Gluconacetobacter tumulisoli]MBB2200499.1 GntR family transcriptional regulator [Gluconacetobacter tumulisoli]
MSASGSLTSGGKGAVLRSDRAPPLATQVFDRLRADIVCGRLLPGARISEKVLCDRLAVSRTPVREALLRLVADGLVRSRPQSGTFVAPIEVDRVLEAQFIREHLECGMVPRILDNWSADVAAALTALVDRQADAAAAGDLAEFHELDEAFHATLADTAGLAGVWDVITMAKPHLDRVRILSLDRQRHVRRLIDQHAAIVRAFDRQDGRGAQAMLRTHLREVLRSLRHLRDPPG